jgi:hypothetical protein
MVRESDAERCAVRLSAQRAPTNARDNIWPDRSMRTGQCLQFIVLDLVFIVRELKVRIPAHHTSSSRSSPTQPQLVQTVHTPMPKEKKKRYRVIGLCPRRASEGLFAGLHPCSHAMQPRCSDRVWEPPAARAPVSAALSRVRPIVVIDFSKKKKGTNPTPCHGPRVSDVSFLVALLSASPHVWRASCRFAVGSRIGGKRDSAYTTPDRPARRKTSGTQGWRGAHLTTNCGARPWIECSNAAASLSPHARKRDDEARHPKPLLHQSRAAECLKEAPVLFRSPCPSPASCSTSSGIS